MTTFYLINLDDSKDRLNKSSKRLEAQGIEFQRVSGIRGASLSKEELLENYSPTLNRKEYYYPLSPSQIGCYMSHRKAWRKIAEGDDDFGVVLEDDFVLTGDLTKAVKTIEMLDIKWDLIKLSAYANRPRPVAFSHPISNDFDLAVHKKPMSGGAATAITKHAAKKLLEATEKFGRPCDTDLQYFWDKDIEILSLLPYPVAQDLEYESTISTSRSKEERRVIRRALQQPFYYIKNKIEVMRQVDRLKQQLSR